MSTLLILITALVAGKTLAVEVTVRVGTPANSQPLKFIADFSFDLVLISDDQYQCQEPNCQLVDSRYQYDVYNYEVYGFRKVLVQFVITADGSSEILTIKVPAQLGKYPFNVFGINPDSVLGQHIGSRGLKFNSSTKRLFIDEGAPSDELSVFYSDDRPVHHLKAIMSYALQSKYDDQPIIHQNYANACFHDLKATDNLEFFIAGTYSFIYDWYEFLINCQKIEKELKFHEYKISSLQTTANASIVYNNSVFKEYKKPFRYFRMKFYPQCEVFIGDFALKQAGFEFVLRQSEIGNGLAVGARLSSAFQALSASSLIILLSLMLIIA